jgi:hypothetical protein
MQSARHIPIVMSMLLLAVCARPARATTTFEPLPLTTDSPSPEPTMAATVQSGAIAIEAVYRAEAACVGLERPKPPPTVEIRPGRYVRCPGATPNGKCAGLHHPRKIIVAYATAAAIPHELLHDVLCQLPRDVNPLGCDSRHLSPFWSTCVPQ